MSAHASTELATYMESLGSKKVHRLKKVSLCYLLVNSFMSSIFTFSVKKLCYDLIKKYHPDRATDYDATKRFQILQTIKRTLTDAEKRRLYDAEGIVDIENSEKTYIISDDQLSAAKMSYVGEWAPSFHLIM